MEKEKARDVKSHGLSLFDPLYLLFDPFQFILSGSQTDLFCLIQGRLPFDVWIGILEMIVMAEPDWHCHHDHFKDSNPNIEWKATLDQAEKIGLGTRQYELKRIK